MMTITDVEKQLEELPLLPNIIVRLLALDPNHKNYFEQVFELAQADPTFALRIIRLSNSASSSPVNPIKTLHSAFTRVGVKPIVGLVTSMSAMRIFVPNKPGEKYLWLHSIQVATGARVIAQLATGLNVNPEQAYLCGLMHDIGRFVLFDKARDALSQVDEAGWSTPKALIDTEQELYGFTHSEIGARVCKKWGLPQFITDVVRHHHVHNLKNIPDRDTKYDNLIHIIQMADAFSMVMTLNPNILSWSPQVLAKELESKCIRPSSSNPALSAKQLQTQVGKIVEESNKIISVLGLSPPA